MHQLTLYDIAGAAGVSLATVSRVLNHPELVKPDTRERIMAIIRKNGFVRNPNAVSLASGNGRCIAVVVPTLTRAAVAELIQAVYDAAERLKYEVKLFVNNLAEVSSSQWKATIVNGVDGILFMNDELDRPTYDFIQSTPLPVVFVNTLSKDNSVSSVVIDYEKSSYDITRHFVDQGIKDILFINTKHYYQTNEARFNGYKKAMAEHRLPIKFIETVGDLEINQYDFTKYLEANGAPRVAIAVRDSMAISFMNEAQKRGVKVPDEMEVVGLQNTRYSQLSNPTLTCVEMPIYDVGARAVKKLAEMLESDEEVEIEKIVVPYSIIHRASTK